MHGYRKTDVVVLLYCWRPPGIAAHTSKVKCMYEYLYLYERSAYVIWFITKSLVRQPKLDLIMLVWARAKVRRKFWDPHGCIP